MSVQQHPSGHIVLIAVILLSATTASRAAPDFVPSPRARSTDDSTAARPSPVSCEGRFVQGGVAVCRATPGMRVQIGAAQTRTDAEGYFVLGFDRDAPPVEVGRFWDANGTLIEHPFEIERRTYDLSRIDGLPPSQVDRYSKAQLARIEASTTRKQNGDASRASLSAFRQRFIWPLQGRKTSSFGAQRILNGTRKRPHYGVDLAAPKGTSIVAPADGIVSLADDDLYFEGAMIVIDHGQGFLSKYLHVSRIDVESGQRVRRGDLLGAVGSRGRSTGPHLCWRLKWRDRNLDPELWVLPEINAAADHRGIEGP